MKKHLKIIIPIVLGIAGIIVVYQFVIVSREEAKKLESARQDAFFKCDKRFDVVMQQIKGLPQSMLDDIMLDIEFKCAVAQTSQFNIDSPLHCDLGTDGQYHGFVHNRDSYINGCVIWTMDKLSH
ncbi:MAG: hypothetical protein A3G02_00160 [Candidatus Yanofskybacteria bacterium RIFCSPLOWO2_12_FULL_44_13b]|uniref:Uncharacterized protein n=1 Tax=Candidatus Yanofskybacteria bacterium RIFCSPLOWO2_02_FULL_44_18 TaxID=1802705 RepID=A0A1F8H2U1_9BACT|nr:MAG: hypothetical protein A2657_01000 [Candidatus Yanofskybacteria bacterium RIFCSPHIGHO2_01_FULL_44_110b]OGN15162.1 MAG: hypothetical protein A3C01_01825 [Candidatus Yanofskybacteria bacterium RIFCSPHIGHO2_02_FULL_44_36b]OGN18439.1 MAG: hypothetical protein A3F50_01415 [Candidatus Yanofskybacteria bacterium RIFCSPHIGHO2_12_FULL_44_29b]OGN26590.1 MAG: hypothetical protein A3B12_01155 [Candidatus Yanofskybacteria bacterium RIFCSPLOWO2_01_FULL_44_88]OGN31268.1 MAG: hypothetical protein A3I96_0